MENILTDGQCLFPNTVHVLPQKFDGLNFYGLAGKRQKHQNFPLSKFPPVKISRYVVCGFTIFILYAVGTMNGIGLEMHEFPSI